MNTNVNYTGRAVIAPDRTLRSDQVKLSYHSLVGLMQQVIINILHKSYNMQYSLLEKYIKNGEKEKAAILGQKIRELNEEIEGAKTKKLTPENKK